MELLLKLDDHECRENANGRMIDHLNKTITLKKGRIRTSKKGYIGLNTEVSRMKKKERTKIDKQQSTKKQKVVEKSGEEGIRYDVLDSSDDDEEHEDDDFQIEKQCNVELHFDCTSSRTSTSGTGTQINVMDDNLAIGDATEEDK